MYMKQGLRGGLGSLTALAAEENCPEPDGAKRTELIAAAHKLYHDYNAQTPARGRGFHWTEGHPDLRAWWEDWYPRIRGLAKRPKLMRCSKKARDRMVIFISQAEYVLANSMQTAASNVHIKAPGFRAPLHGSRVYWIRGPFWDGRFQTPGGKKPPARELAPGGGGGGQAPAPAAPTPSGPVGEPSLLPFKLPPEVAGVWEALTVGDIFGIPRAYLTYGFAGLVVYNVFLKGGRRR